MYDGYGVLVKNDVVVVEFDGGGAQKNNWDTDWIEPELNDDVVEEFVVLMTRLLWPLIPSKYWPGSAIPWP